MSNIYYKVVNYYLQSAIVNPPFTTQYKINEFVSAPDPRFPLCVFDCVDSAKEFAHANAGKVYKCKIKTKLRKPWIPYKPFKSLQLFYTVQKLMTKKQRFMHLVCINGLPKHAVCCKQVMLLEEVK